MSEHETDPENPAVQSAKGAARAAIGKLIGDDAEIRAGHGEGTAAGPGDRPTTEETKK